MRSLVTFAFLSGLFPGYTSAHALPLKITTFNIEYYGTKSPAAQTQEADRRNASIQRFLQVAGVDPDVFAFEEIVDKTELETSLLKNKYSCHSYDHSTSNHQHVVVCHKKTFNFRIANDDNNMAWEDVAMGTLRPAVHGILSVKGGRDLAHIVALHLKAMPDQSARRLSQTAILAERIKTRGDRLPVVMLGDLNTYEDDIDLMTEKFRQEGVSLTPLENLFDHTYRSSRYSNKFDWMLVSDEVDLLEDVQVDGPCNDEWESGTSFDNLTYYNENVSDHCPVSAVLDL
jgi:endonuclease/exonuclease/phosphatase family metal-dependent hydrolase